MRRSSGLHAASVFLLATACNGSSEGSERACVTLGDSGGTITSHDKVLTLAVRPGALDENVEVCITPAEAPPDGPPMIYGSAYRVRPDLDLAINATATYRAALPMNPAGVAVGVILREDFDAGRGRWLSLPVTRLEPENELVAGSDPGLSMYYGLCAGTDCEGELPDPGDTDTDTGSTMTGATDNPTSGAASTTTDDPTATMGVLTEEGTTEPETTDDPTDETSAGSSSEGGSESTSGTVADCDSLPEPPFDVTPLGNVFPQPFPGIGSEDLAMTGNGTFIGMSGNSLLESDAEGNTDLFYSPVSSALYGLRVNAAGQLLGFNSNSNDIDVFDMSSQEQYADTSLTFGNGIYPDNDGNVWATDFGGNRIVRVNSDLTIDTISDTTQQPNGVFFDEGRRLLFWSRYGASELHAIPIDDEGEGGADVLVTDLTGQTDGITMDACGHIYAVDQAGAMGTNPCRIDRVHLDEAGALAAEGVVEIAGGGDLGNGCSNAQFGYGFGDDNDRRLFVTGIPGNVYVVDVGIPGYPIP